MKKLFLLLLMLPFLYSCSDDESEEEVRNKRIIEAVKAIEQYKDAYDFREFEEKNGEFEDTNWYKSNLLLIAEYESDLQAAIDRGDEEMIERYEEFIDQTKEALKDIKSKFTKPYYVVKFDLPSDDPHIQYSSIVSLNNNFVYLGGYFN